MVADRENAALAATLIEETCLKQDIEPQGQFQLKGIDGPVTLYFAEDG